MKFEIQGDPIAKMRARYTTRGGFVRTYDPQSDDKEVVKWRMTKFLQAALVDDNKDVSNEAASFYDAASFNVKFKFFIGLNRSDSDSVKNLKLWGMLPCASKPDIDNLEKFYLDCANNIFWKDDSMIVKMQSEKQFDENPRVEMEIMTNKTIKLNKQVEDIVKQFNPDSLKEFIYDAKKLSESFPEDCLEYSKNNPELWFTSTARVVSEFASKYANKLKKIEKYGKIEAM